MSDLEWHALMPFVLRRSGAAVSTDRPEIAWIFAAGNEVGTVGAWAFLVASVATSLALLRTGGRWAAVGGPVLVVAAVPFLDSHIYWPTGGLTVLGIAAGLGLLAVASHRARAGVAAGTGGAAPAGAG